MPVILKLFYRKFSNFYLKCFIVFIPISIIEEIIIIIIFFGILFKNYLLLFSFFFNCFNLFFSLLFNTLYLFFKSLYAW